MRSQVRRVISKAKAQRTAKREGEREGEGESKSKSKFNCKERGKQQQQQLRLRLRLRLKEHLMIATVAAALPAEGATHTYRVCIHCKQNKAATNAHRRRGGRVRERTSKGVCSKLQKTAATRRMMSLLLLSKA